MPKLTYDIGYYGKVSIGKGTAAKYILSTGGSLTLQYTPIMTTGVWGAYWKNATQKIAYAPNFIALSANSGFQLTKDLLETIKDFAFDKRNESKEIAILPNGVAGYTGMGYCISFSLQTSQDALVTGDIGFKSGDVSSTTSSFSSSSNTSSSTSTIISTMVPGYTDVYPYWASGVFLAEIENTDRGKPAQVTTGNVGDVVDWSASYSSQLVLVACCSGKGHGVATTPGDKDSGKAGVSADYCALGTMQAQGSFTMVGIGTYLSPDNVQKHNKCSIKMATTSGEGKVSINYGALIWTNASTDVQTGSSLIQSSFSFNALGNTTEAPMNFTVPTTQ